MTSPTWAELDADEWYFAPEPLDLLRSICDEHDGEDPSDPATVQAMGIVLHLPKNSAASAADDQHKAPGPHEDPLSRPDLLSAAAVASLAVCLDPRAASDTGWNSALTNWYGARIRKITRRARKNGQWESVQHVPGVTATVGKAQARAFLPTPVGSVDRRIARLQIEGTDVSHTHGDEHHGGPLLITNGHWEMSVGKLAAQVGHAAMLWAAYSSTEDVKQWIERPGFRVQELTADEFSRRHETYSDQQRVIDVQDAGYTEVDPGAITAAAVVNV